MIFLFIILFLLSILLVSFTIQNKQRYGTFLVPLIFSILCIGGTIFFGFQLPSAIQKIQKNNDAQVNSNKLTKSQQAHSQSNLENGSKNKSLLRNLTQHIAKLVTSLLIPMPKLSSSNFTLIQIYQSRLLKQRPTQVQQKKRTGRISLIHF